MPFHSGPNTSPRGSRLRGRRRGQSLVEFALVLPVLLLLLGGAVQYGVIFAGKSTLIQVARDTARWAATQVVTPCSDAATATDPEPLTIADRTASGSALIDFVPGMWDANFVAYADNAPLPATPPHSEGVEVVWSFDTGGACPPSGNAIAAFVTVRISHTVPAFLPGLGMVPGAVCNGSGCHLGLSATSTFRMEPPPP